MTSSPPYWCFCFSDVNPGAVYLVGTIAAWVGRQPSSVRAVLNRRLPGKGFMVQTPHGWRLAFNGAALIGLSKGCHLEAYTKGWNHADWYQSGQAAHNLRAPLNEFSLDIPD